MIKNIRKLLLFCLMIIIFSSSSFAAVEIFSTYNTNIQIHKNETMDVHKSIVLQNIHVVGIVPGRVEFKIPKSSEDSVSKIELENFKVLDQYGRDIKSEVFETSEGSTIALDIFTPLLPGFRYPIEIYYTISYDSSGFFFKNLEIPVKEQTSIDIREGLFNVTLPDGYSFTFLDYEGNVTRDGKSAIAEIDTNSPSSLRLEYSFIPVNLFGLKGSYIFWIFINLILLIILVIEIRKEIIKFKKDNK